MTPLIRMAGAGLCVLTGCVPVPVPIAGDVDELDVPPPLAAPMAAGDSVAILGGGYLDDDEGIPACVRTATARADKTLHMIPPQVFRDSLFPWFEASTMPFTAERLALAIGQPAVQAKLSALNLRHVVRVNGSTSERPRDSSGPSESWTRTSRLSATILDFREAHWSERLALSVSARGSSTYAVVAQVFVIPMTESRACEEFGRQLAAYLTGKPAPKPKSARSEAPDE